MTATSANPTSRVRLRADQRREQIVEAATRLLGEKGYFGFSLQDICDAVGLSQAGLLHHVGNKEGLLWLVLEQQYDRRFDPGDYISTGDAAAIHPDGVSLPGYLRYLVAHNAQRPELVRLYSVLGAESASPSHPAHRYFAGRPDDVWDLYCKTRWRVPSGVGPWETQRPLVEMALASMDGLQLRLFREPKIDLEVEWAYFESVLFPAPLWDGYR